VEVFSMIESEPIRVMTVDDHEILRGGLRFLLLAFEDIELVGEARSGSEAVRLCSQLQPDVVLMDIMMPGMDGAVTTQTIKEQYPDIQVLVLSSFSDQESVQRVMRAGAIGYLLKDVSMDELADGIRAAYAGKAVLAPEAAQALVRAVGPQVPEPGCDLTDNEIAERLVLSPYTVRNHVSEILSKLGASTRTEAVALAVRLGLVG
jgi:NarL family two-component system response regulator LiaR